MRLSTSWESTSWLSGDAEPGVGGAGLAVARGAGGSWSPSAAVVAAPIVPAPGRVSGKHRSNSTSNSASSSRCLTSVACRARRSTPRSVRSRWRSASAASSTSTMATSTWAARSSPRRRSSMASTAAPAWSTSCSSAAAPMGCDATLGALAARSYALRTRRRSPNRRTDGRRDAEQDGRRDGPSEMAEQREGCRVAPAVTPPPGRLVRLGVVLGDEPGERAAWLSCATWPGSTWSGHSTR